MSDLSLLATALARTAAADRPDAQRLEPPMLVGLSEQAKYQMLEPIDFRRNNVGIETNRAEFSSAAAGIATVGHSALPVAFMSGGRQTETLDGYSAKLRLPFNDRAVHKNSDWSQPEPKLAEINPVEVAPQILAEFENLRQDGTLMQEESSASALPVTKEKLNSLKFRETNVAMDAMTLAVIAPMLRETGVEENQTLDSKATEAMVPRQANKLEESQQLSKVTPIERSTVQLAIINATDSQVSIPRAPDSVSAVVQRDVWPKQGFPSNGKDDVRSKTPVIQSSMDADEWERSATPEIAEELAPRPVPLLLAAPENFDPALMRPKPVPSPADPTNTPSIPIATPKPKSSEAEASFPEPETAVHAPVEGSIAAESKENEHTANSQDAFFKLESMELNLDNDLSRSSGEQNKIFEPVFQGRLRDGTPINFTTGFNVYEQPNIAKVTNIPLRVGYEQKIKGIPVDISAGVDLFDRLPAAPNVSAKARIPLGQRAVLSMAVDHSAYKFNAETLENRISAVRYGPSLFWQIDDQTTLFSNVTWGRYSDGNREQQSFSRLERRLGKEISVAANLFNWRYREDKGNRSGYFSPPDFLVANVEAAWEKPLSKALSCRLSGNVGRQHVDGEWSQAYGYDARCTVNLNRRLDLDVGYHFSNVLDRKSGDSASSSRELKSQVRWKF